MNKFQNISDACSFATFKLWPSKWLFENSNLNRRPYGTCSDLSSFHVHGCTLLEWLRAIVFPLHLHSMCARGCTSRLFRTVFFFAYRIVWSQHQWPSVVMLQLMFSSCAHVISDGAPFLILFSCSVDTILELFVAFVAIKIRIEMQYYNIGTKDVWFLGSTIVVGAWVACEHAKQQLATICVTICLSTFYLSFATTPVEWHLIFIVNFLFDMACAYEFHIRFGLAVNAPSVASN